MPNWLQVALALFQLAPQVVTLVGGVETAIGTAPGAAKKTVVMAPIVAAGAPPAVQSGVSALIDHIVAGHKAVPPKPAAPAVGPAAPAAAPLAS